MDITLQVLGGLGLFLYGMNLMGDGLQKIAGEKLKKLIEVLTKNRFMAVIVGAIVTMVIQSSSGTTVMVIGFVNAGLMTLNQAVGVIMGANIGTTITAQLIAFKITDYAPLAVAVGVIIWLISKKKKTKNIGEILIGFGILFIGMNMMGEGLKPLADAPVFAKVIVSLENPILGMVVGLLLTTIVQSSSASIGLLQALAGQGLIGINIAIPILFGENIGTTTTALVSSIGANKTAKRAAMMHFLFNLVGTIIFMTVLRWPIKALVIYLSPTNVPRQIANAHTFFNILNVMIQFPFAGLLVKTVNRLIPGDDEVEKQVSKYLDLRIIGTPSIALGQVKKEILRMGDFVQDNLIKSRKALVDDDYGTIEPALEQEQIINQLQKEISNYLIEVSSSSLSTEQSKRINRYHHFIGDIERVGDHAENIIELAQEKMTGNLPFTELATSELNEMFSKCQKVYELAMEAFDKRDESLAKRVLILEDEIDDLEYLYRQNHIERLNKGQCLTSSGIIFLDAISNLERVSDHSSNIALNELEIFKK